ncbi:von Willebrand factor type A domain-containing protein [Xanthomonas vesicatoria]|nr:VWA domain-containing protein [Xanthomonas vesicatoria]MCC8616727.1 von Willebrand factor type A domain-containing protein [Xanthomonas vesicatoria]MCC8630394.1 von Willebrand factor type A domain-containing protein [Xanthomonas vesicatoria]
MPRQSLLALALLLSACSHEPTSPVVGDPPASPVPDAAAATPSPPEIAYTPIPESQPAPPPVMADPAPIHPSPVEMAYAPSPPAPAAPQSVYGAFARQAPAAALMAQPQTRSMIMQAPPVAPAENRETYQTLSDNPVVQAADNPVSTFSIDVDTGSYSNVRRYLTSGSLPPVDAVRVEEMINYFRYDDPAPRDGQPFAVRTELAPTPWNHDSVLLRIGITGRAVAASAMPAANLVFLVDVSGSMGAPDKLPLLQSSLKLLTRQLRAQDRITLVTYAGNTAVVLPPTPGNQQARIVEAIDSLQSGGGTAGASGIELAYKAAQQSYLRGGINRILLATDGDFNVGVTDFDTLKGMVAEKRRSGVALSTLGFGTGNYNDTLMEQLADAGDGAYAYIDSPLEARKVLTHELGATLETIARDVKIQVEFNPATVQEYRLIGYENRALRREDFNNDQVDAGDIGAGHSVTALYEITPARGEASVDPLRYATAAKRPAADNSNELAHLKLRYKLPDAHRSRLLDTVIRGDQQVPLNASSDAFRFAAAVAGFGQRLRGGNQLHGWDYPQLRALAAGSIGKDRFGYRADFLRMVQQAEALSSRPVATTD